jgi:hypothetical protein
MLHLGAGGRTSGFSDFQFAEPQTLPIEWESAGWSYQINGEVGGGWQTGLQFGLVGQGGFGEDHNSCSLIQTATHTGWAPGNGEVPSYLYLRRDVTVTTAGFLEISVAIDNDLIVYVDGSPVIYAGEGDFLLHEGCPERGSASAFVFVEPGVHQIAIVARDRGGSSYFDASIGFVLGEGGGN